MTSTTRRSFLTLAAAALTGVGVTGCSLITGDDGQTTAEAPAAGPAEVATPIEASKTLVAFLSVPETDDPNDMTDDEKNSTHVVDGKVLGNVEYVAGLVASRTGAEVFRIDTAEPLPRDHDTLEELALKWQEAGERPKLKKLVSNIADFDTVFIGYPIWWYDLPMPLYSFLEQHDFAGKTVVLFSVHGGSQLSGTDDVITKLLKDSTVVSNALTISRSDMDDSADDVQSWLDDVTAA